jgi:hypothetical protein
LLDEVATASEIRRLERLLLRSRTARATYVKCMQVHAFLHYTLGGTDVRLPSAVEKLCEKRTKEPTGTAKATHVPAMTTGMPLYCGIAS